MSRPSSASAVVRIRSFVSVVATFFLLFLILAAAGGGGSVNAQEEEQTESSDTTTDTTSNNNVSYTNLYGWEASSEVIEWEKSNLIAWSKTPDCLPSTGMCNSCGLGAIVVEFKQIINNSTDINSISSNYTTGGAVYESFSSEFINDNIYLEDSIIDDKKKLTVGNLPDFINKDGIQYAISRRSYSIGLGGNPSPWDYNKQSIEIASYTKAITALTMQVQIEEGSVSEDFLIKDFLPECDWESSVSALSGDDGGDVGSIAFEELRLHLSGLPAQPPNRAETGSPGGNPFGGYTVEMLCESLLKISGLPTRGRFSYSNYGYGILGFLLTRAEAIAIAAAANDNDNNNSTTIDFDNAPSYEELVRSKVLKAFEMNNTVVAFDPDTAATGCKRGLLRDESTIRIGEYGVLQGNGALRSTLPDMGNFLEAIMISNTIEEEQISSQNIHKAELVQLFRALQTITIDGGVTDACKCVSDWCEGWLCPLPNPLREKVTKLGTTQFTSGLITGGRKSGDTDGYSVRGVWFTEQTSDDTDNEKFRGAFVVDTCGGCDTIGTAGSAAQRLALILADGPPTTTSTTSSSSNDSKDTNIDKDDNNNNGTNDNDDVMVYKFSGFAPSYAFPSNVVIHLEVREPGINDNNAKAGVRPDATVFIASSDGMGCSSSATKIDGGWELDHSALYGCGWSSGDPIDDMIQQSHKLLLLKDGSGGVALQAMGDDIYLEKRNVSSSNSNSSTVSGGGGGVDNTEQISEEGVSSSSSPAPTTAKSNLLACSTMFFVVFAFEYYSNPIH